MSTQPGKPNAETEKPAVKVTGFVEKIIESPFPNVPDKAQILVEQADDLYKEIRIENKLEDESGKPVALKLGAPVDVTIEAEPENTIPLKPSKK